MLFETNKDKGRAGMAVGVAYFGANGYTINIPLNDTQWYDFVIEKDGKFETVQCKATGSQDNAISLRSSGGTKGTVYDFVCDHPVDWLFCLDRNGNMFAIPGEVLREAGNKRSIVLRTEPTANNQGLQTHLYQVKL